MEHEPYVFRKRNVGYPLPGMKICDEHDWVVFSTAVEDGERWLLLQCIACGMDGYVEDPTEDEWARGSAAPTRPYRWSEDARVVVKGFLSKQFYVQFGAFGSVEPTPYWKQVQREVSEDVKWFREREQH